MAPAHRTHAWLLLMAACGGDSSESELRSLCTAECKMFERCGSLQRRSANGEMLSLEGCERDCNERGARARELEVDSCEVEWSSSDIEACVDAYGRLSCEEVAQGKVLPDACSKSCTDL